MKEYWTLFWTFCRIGGLTFGGGYAMLPMLQRELVENRKWVTEEEILNYFAIGQCTPGVIAVNTADCQAVVPRNAPLPEISGKKAQIKLAPLSWNVIRFKVK